MGFEFVQRRIVKLLGEAALQAELSEGGDHLDDFTHSLVVVLAFEVDQVLNEGRVAGLEIVWVEG